MGNMHIYAQDAWHDNAYIMGDREALAGLRDAIDTALRDGIGAGTVVASDGEGYDVVVRLCTVAELNELSGHYTALCARRCRSEAVEPGELCREFLVKRFKERE